MTYKKSSIIEDLQDLKKLYDDGTLDEREFELAKKRLFGTEQETFQQKKTLRELYSDVDNTKSLGINKKGKDRKKFKILYVSIPLLLVLFTISFLLFGPFNVLGFSEFGDKILGRESNTVKDLADKDLDKTQTDTEETTELEDVPKEEKVEEPTIEKKNTTSKTSTVSCSQSDIDNYFKNFCYWYDIDGNKTAEWGEKLFVICNRTDYGPEKCPKKYICSDEQITNLKNEIAEKKDGKARAEAIVNDRFFICFDELTATVPSQTDTWYKQECARIICMELYPDLCSLPDDFQAEIDELQIELNHCLSDR